jgi:hypothetical protein
MDNIKKQEWEVVVSITRTLRYPIEDNEDIAKFKDCKFLKD